MVPSLGARLDAAVLIVVHGSPDAPGRLPDILARDGALPAVLAVDEQRIEPGRIYVARPDCHLLVEDEHLRLRHGPRENGFRPAVDPLFRSAAAAYGARVVAVVLSGALDDGTHGASVVKQFGGLVLAQEPTDAVVAGMPTSAIRSGAVDEVLTAAALGARVRQLVNGSPPGESNMPRERSARPGAGHETSEGKSRDDAPVALTCPECGGALREMTDGQLLRFRCHVGHAYGADTLAQDQDGQVETAMWTALRVLEESIALRQRLAERARARGLAGVAHACDERTATAERHAGVLRRLLEEAPPPPDDEPTT